MIAPKVSVVTIVRNDAEGFLVTARSVLKQSYPNIEWIVIDGASTDNTSMYVKSLASCIDKHIIEPDTGIYNAMNKAIDMISGDWVIFLNADDIFFSEDVIQKYVDSLETGDEVVFADVIRREDLGIQYYRHDSKYKLGMTFDHQSAFVQSRFYKKYKYDESLKISGDLNFFSTLRINNCKFRKVQGLIACKKPFDVGASSSYASRQNERVKVLMNHFKEDWLCETLKIEFVAALAREDIQQEQYNILIEGLK